MTILNIAFDCDFLNIGLHVLCFHFDALTELGASMQTEFVCISVLRVTPGPRVKLAVKGLKIPGGLLY